MPVKTPDPLVGSVFGRLTIVLGLSGKGNDRRYTCQCICGTEKRIAKGDLVKGKVKSCGCLNKELLKERSVTHGLTLSPTYTSWCHMKSRCQNPAVKNYAYYGGRGISVCSDWLDFENFYRDMGASPFKGASVERLDTNKGYCKENCVWADCKTQANNRRSSVLFEYNKKMYTLRELAKVSKVGVGTLRNRLYTYNWPVDRAVEEPALALNERPISTHATATPAARHKLYPQP